MTNQKNYYLTKMYIMVIIPFLIMIPKSISIIFNFIPIRLILIIPIIPLFVIEYFKYKEFSLSKSDIFLSWLYLPFMISLFCSIYSSSSLILSLYSIMKYCLYFIMFIIIKNLKFNKKEQRIIYIILILSALTLFIIGIINYFFNFNLSLNAATKYGVNGRVFVTFANPIYYGMFCNMIVLLILFLKTKANNIKESIVLYIVLVLGILNIFLTFTRSAYLILIGIIGLFYIFQLFEKKFFSSFKKTWLILLFMIIVIFKMDGVYKTYYSAAYSLLPTSIFEIYEKVDSYIYKLFTDKKILTSEELIEEVNNNEEEVKENNSTIIDDTNENIEIFDYQQDISLENRELFKNIAYNVAKDNVINGIGIGNYEEYVNNDKVLEKYNSKLFGYPHNFYLHIFAETGLLGLLSSLLFLLSALIVLLINYLKSKNYLIIILWLSLILLGFYESIFYDIQLMPLVLIISSLYYNKNAVSNKTLLKNVIVELGLLIIISLVYGLINNYLLKEEKQIPVLIYHHFLSEKEKNLYDNNNYAISVETFEKEMAYLRDNGYQTISAEKLYCWKKNKCNIDDKSVLITIDDGLLSSYHYAKPILEKYGFNAILFVISSRLQDITEKWNSANYQYVGKDIITKKDDTLTIGSHSHNLHILKDGVQEIYRKNHKELVNDAKETKELLNTSFYSYPFNTYTKEQIEIIKESGFKIAFRGQNKMTTKKEDLYLTSRIYVSDKFEEFEKIFTTDIYKTNRKKNINKKIVYLMEKFL